MSDSVNDELEQLLDEWIESIMREVRKAREARLAEIQQELMPYQPGSIPSNKSLKRGGAPGMACRRPQSTRHTWSLEKYDCGDKNHVAKEHRGEG